MERTPGGHLVQPPVQSCVKYEPVQSVLASWGIPNYLELPGISPVVNSQHFLGERIPKVIRFCLQPCFASMQNILLRHLLSADIFTCKPTCRVLLQLCIDINSDMLCICYQMQTLIASLCRDYWREDLG